jgi:hypothetical protein
MARFVIADFTDPKIVLQEASEVVRNSNVPVQPLLLKSCEEPVTLLDLKAGRRTILPTFVYENDDHLIRSLKESIIKPANERVEQLIAEKQKIFEEFEKNLKLERERKPVVSEDTNDHALLHQVSIADEIQEAIALRDAGELTQEQFEEYKKRLLY